MIDGHTHCPFCGSGTGGDAVRSWNPQESPCRENADYPATPIEGFHYPLVCPEDYCPSPVAPDTNKRLVRLPQERAWS